MATAVSIDQRLTENHVATALAIDGFSLAGGLAHPVEKAIRFGKALGPQLGVAAGQINRLRRRLRRFVGERRKEVEFSAGPAPFVEQVWVGKAERIVARDCNALPEWRDARSTFVGKRRGRCQAEQSVDIEMGRDLVCGALNYRLGLTKLGCRHEPEMPRR